MTHLEFVDKLNELGVAIRGNSIEDKEKTYIVPFGILSSKKVVVKNFGIRWADGTPSDWRSDAKRELIRKAIDLDTWKHSWHSEVSPENYEKFREIIMEKILDRAKEIEMLLTVYFILNKDISDQKYDSP